MNQIKTWQQRQAETGLGSVGAKDDEIRELRQAIEQAEKVEPVACKPLCELCIKRGYGFCANTAKTTVIPAAPTAPAQQPLTEQAWECNECGSQEYASILSEHEVHELGCGNCGSSEWHLADIKGASL